MIVIIQYGLGNPRSIQNMLKRVGAESVISSNRAEIECASKLILPGVGAFDHGMQNLRSTGLDAILTERVLTAGVPFLGVCLGMQLLSKSSEEGHATGLNWIAAETVRFKFTENSDLKIPHMGWNEIIINEESKSALQSSYILKDLEQDARFYFVHSYHLKLSDTSLAIANCQHGYLFPAIISQRNILAAQFHPEKSHKYGMRLLNNFLNWQPQQNANPIVAHG